MFSALKRAFNWHWHLLALGSATGVALLSGNAGMMMPLVAAAEIAYLGLLGLNPRFQKVLIATGKNDKPAVVENPNEQFRRLLDFLGPEDLERFQHVRRRCASLIDLRNRMDGQSSNIGVKELRNESVDRMLWLFLKLLHQKSGMERFLATTDRVAIDHELAEARIEFQHAQERDQASSVESRLTSSIRERISTIESRMENLHQAESNLELVTAEISKTEQQITHLCEVGMTGKDSAGLTAQIDSISSSMQSTESTFANSSLDSILDEDTVPPLVSLSSMPPQLPQNRRLTE
jgi:hypothetical protein